MIIGLSGRQTVGCTGGVSLFLLSGGTRVTVVRSYDRCFGKVRVRCSGGVARLFRCYSVTVAMNNSKAVVRTTGCTTGTSGRLVNIGINELNFTTSIRPRRCRRLRQLVANSCAARREVLLSIRIVGRSNSGRCLTIGSTIITENRLSGAVSLRLALSNSRVSGCETSNLLFTAPANSATCSLSTNKPVLTPGVRYVLVAPIYPRSLFSHSMLFDKRSRLSIRIGVPRRYYYILAVSNRGGIPILTASEIMVHGSSLGLGLTLLRGHGFCGLLGRGLGRESF